MAFHWKSLKALYGSMSRVCIFSFNEKLQNIKKGVKNISDYLSELATIVYALANANDVVNDQDLVMYAINGLGNDYVLFVQNVNMRVTK